jgi:hypothetical protein
MEKRLIEPQRECDIDVNEDRVTKFGALGIHFEFQTGNRGAI